MRIQNTEATTKENTVKRVLHLGPNRKGPMRMQNTEATTNQNAVHLGSLSGLQIVIIINI